MKRALCVVVVVVVLAGCNAIPVTTPTVAMTTIPLEISKTVAAGIDASPEATGAFTAQPTPTEKPESPSPTPTATPTPAPKADSVTDPGLRVGFVVSNDDSVFYLERQYGEAETKYSIHQLDLKANQKKILREFSDSPITQIFLDGAGSLYYVKSIVFTNAEKGVTTRQNLYQYASGQDRLIASYIDSVIRVDQEHVFYIGPSGSIYQYHIVSRTKTKIAQVSLEDKNLNVSYFSCLGYFLLDVRNTTNAEYRKYRLVNLYTGKASLLSEKPEDQFINSDDGECLIKYSHSGKSTPVTIYDMETNKTSEFSVSGSLWIDRAFVHGEFVYLVARSGTKQQQSLYEINLTNGKVQAQTGLPYHIGSSVAHNGMWYFYTYVYSTNGDTEHVKQSIRSMDLQDGKITTLYSFKHAVDNGHCLRLDIMHDSLWLDYCGGEEQSHNVISRFLIK